MEPAQAHRSAHGPDGRSQAGHVSHTECIPSAPSGPPGWSEGRPLEAFYQWGWEDTRASRLPSPPPVRGPVTMEWRLEWVTLVSSNNLSNLDCRGSGLQDLRGSSGKTRGTNINCFPTFFPCIRE